MKMLKRIEVLLTLLVLCAGVGEAAVIYEEHFDTDPGDWQFSDPSIYVDSDSGWLYIDGGGDVSDSAWINLSFILPVTIETRIRLSSGGGGYRLPWVGVSSDSGRSATTYLPNAAAGCGWKFMEAGWTLIDTMGPTAVGEWRTLKQTIYPDSGLLWVKTDSDTSYTLVVDASWSMPLNYTAISFSQPWDAECQLDYVIVTSLEEAPDSLLLPSVFVAPCDDECAVQPMEVSLTTPIEGISGSITSDEGVKFCGLDRTGLETELWQMFTQLSADSTIISFSMYPEQGDDFLAPGTHTIANLLFEVERLCLDTAYIHFDTALSEDLTWHLMFADTLGNNVVPGFEAESNSTGVIGYIPGDINGDGVGPDISDLVCLVSYMFQGDMPPCVMAAADCNGNGSGPDIADLVYLVNYMFQGGPAPRCSGSISTAKLVQRDDIIISANIEGGQTVINLKSDVDLRGLQLELVGIGSNTPTSLVDGDLDLVYGTVEGELRVGLLDMEGAALIKSGDGSIITIDGEYEIVSAMVADLAFNAIQPSIGSVAGTVVPEVYSLNQNYPNPFNPVTTISFSLAEGGQAKLELFNVMGQRVATLVDGMLDAGPHEFEWDGSAVSSGVYFYRLTTETFIDTKKMLLLK
ncbi:MAG TPA: T9SS type A sorting domain-containing protein [candidate division Zixibacteria bacterium]|nr:T9SS type A sorting domain-containing protein [candidate division Zixibacteria bacterium]